MTNISSLTEPYQKYYKCSEKIDIAQEFRKYKSLIASSDFHEYYEYADSNPSFIYRAIGDEIDACKYDLLVDFCNIDQLTVEGELEKVNKQVYNGRNRRCTDPMPDVEKLPLMTLKRAKKLRAASNYIALMQSKYRSERPIIYELSEIEEKTTTLVPQSDFFVYVRIYCPLKTKDRATVGMTPTLSLQSLIAMYGSQTLDKLRDHISCISDHSISTEISKVPVNDTKGNAKHIYKSGFFFIENTFYNDFRDPTNKDNSRVIREWAKYRKMIDCKTARMEHTTIGSLVLRFGHPWVYQHQGNCEHLITFSNVRFVNPADEVNVCCYPRIIRIKPKSKTYCMTCGVYGADWILLNHSRLPHDPCQQCDKCFRRYNYVNGKKVGSFRAYPYPHDHDLQSEIVAVREKKAAELAKEKRRRPWTRCSEPTVA